MSDHFKRLQQTLDYIEDHIKEDITLEQLAALCYYSDNHYHRIFQSIIGIPVADYIRKRKLAMAAGEIIDTDKSILDIALEYGFNSHETFSRGFKRIFDITPTEYRKLNVHAIPIDFWKVSFKDSDLQKRYMQAVETLCERLKGDSNVIAVILEGSLSYDQIWEKSDIDMEIVVNDNSKPNSSICMIEDDIYINANLMTRSEFRECMSKITRGSSAHSYFSLGTMVYCRDESVKEIFESIGAHGELGERDKSHAIMFRAFCIVNPLHKAEKWLKVKSDARYSYIWLIEALKHMAAIEVLMNDNVPSREVILQALKYNNPIIQKLYIGLMDERKNGINIAQGIESIYEYLRKNLQVIFKPILSYFDKTSELKPLSVIVQDFNSKDVDHHVVCEICEWLCEEGVLVKDISQTRLTNKSSSLVYEPAYFKPGEEEEIMF
ncbi:helix-turn-helix transcriptional regulator [Clostridium sp. 19966]|uniref:helix-turn-helix transcriptional regulator n=1 Tax=Clostridium sp. 19966 TaxID=2768166 RepID=UPI0028DEA114|nr:AraC family transcriptional regulator [Clostridium sp. 19966]MDT8717477.1 helix-turn-helix transcriptional regulator [Clostridium sp. 19966]